MKPLWIYTKERKNNYIQCLPKLTDKFYKVVEKDISQKNAETRRM